MIESQLLDQLPVPAGTVRMDAVLAARLAGQVVRKFVYVPGQVVNLVVG